jgi:hypothetical protein
MRVNGKEVKKGKTLTEMAERSGEKSTGDEG